MQDQLPGMMLDQSERAERQIRELSRVVNYEIREYPVEILVNKYLDGIEDDDNEIFIPDYQREFVWTPIQQSRFIESVMIGLPVPYLFAADANSEIEEKSGRLEVIDGTQRLRTFAAFLKDNLKLKKLEKLSELNGMVFSDLLLSRRRRFNRTTIRLIELTNNVSEETRRDMFDRLNSGGQKLNHMEIRRGVRKGEFIPFIEKCAANEKFRSLASISESDLKRRGYEELVLRFFAYTDNYKKFGHRVVDFLNNYLDEKEGFVADTDGPAMQAEWEKVLDFVEANFECGFNKHAKINFTPRVRFEAIAVGTALALREKPNLIASKSEISKWAYDDEFNKLVTTDGSNSRPRVVNRIEYVRDKLLG